MRSIVSGGPGPEGPELVGVSIGINRQILFFFDHKISTFSLRVLIFHIIMQHGKTKGQIPPRNSIGKIKPTS